MPTEGVRAIQYRHLALQVEGGVARLELATTGRIITAAANWELADAVERVAASESIRAMVLTADPRHGFPASLDAEATTAILDQTVERQTPQLIAGLRIPTVAALFGDIDTAGIELALACDIRIAADGTSFTFSGVHNNRLPLWGGTQRLGRVTGIGRALGMILLGETLSAAEALACGLITRLVPSEELERETKRLVDGLVSGAPTALAYAKEAAYRGADLPMEQALRLEWDLAVLLETTLDRAEGIKAFLEKREPHFTGD